MLVDAVFFESDIMVTTTNDVILQVASKLKLKNVPKDIKLVIKNRLIKLVNEESRQNQAPE